MRWRPLGLFEKNLSVPGTPALTCWAKLWRASGAGQSLLRGRRIG